MTRLEACLLLQSIPGMGTYRCVKMLNHFGSAKAVFEASYSDWLSVEGLGSQVCDALKDWKSYRSKIQNQVTELNKLNLDYLFLGSKNYPKALSFCPDAPLILFYKGSINFNHRNVISIVGTRQNTAHGRDFCNLLIEALKAYNPIICSGLAKGIDIIAHRFALEKGSETVACLAHGLERIYPTEHYEIAQSLCKQGALLTDFFPNSHFRKENFPQRNRLIAGMAHATIVIESGLAGGSMNTATLAHQYGRELFAVPGRPSDSKSQGCHQLIVQQKAQLLSDPQELIKSLGWEIQPKAKGIQKTLFQTLSEEEQKIYDQFSKSNKIGLDELALELGWKISKTAATLIQMEMKGFVRALPGKQFEWI